MLKGTKKYLNYIDNNISSLEDKTVIITGANSGIGFECAKICLYKKAHVVMACRNPNRAEKAKKDLLVIFPDGVIDIIIYDQSNLTSCKEFADTIINKYNGFDVLLLNAGVFKPDNKELTLKTNFFGTLCIIKELEKYLSKINKETRIILEGSLSAYFYKKCNLINYDKYNSYKDMKQYSTSKRGVENIFKYFADNNQNVNVKFLLAEPGISATNIIRGYPKFIQCIAKPFLNCFANKQHIAALPSLYLISNKVANGDYVIPNKLWSIKGYPKYKDSSDIIYKKELIEESLLLIK